jgi:hypothetical protein
MRHTILNKFMFAGRRAGSGYRRGSHQRHCQRVGRRIAKKLTHEIRMYSRYSIFDNIGFFVDEGRVELLGEVSQPFKKADLGRIAQRVPGVTSLSNELKVLPLSPMDEPAAPAGGPRHLPRPGLVALWHAGCATHPHHRGQRPRDSGRRSRYRHGEERSRSARQAGAGLSFGQVTNNLHVENPSHKS